MTFLTRLVSFFLPCQVKNTESQRPLVTSSSSIPKTTTFSHFPTSSDSCEAFARTVTHTPTWSSSADEIPPSLSALLEIDSWSAWGLSSPLPRVGSQFLLGCPVHSLTMLTLASPLGQHLRMTANCSCVHTHVHARTHACTHMRTHTKYKMPCRVYRLMVNKTDLLLLWVDKSVKKRKGDSWGVYKAH